MVELLITPEDIQETAAAFAQASRDSQGVVEKLDKAVAALEGKWAGAAEQTFYKNYKEWHGYMAGLVMLLKSTSQELNVMADRFTAADK